MDLAQLSALNEADFAAALASIYEKSAWIPARAHAAGPFETVAALAAALVAVVDTATEEEQLGLLRAHPDLAGKAALAGDVTDDSALEQSRAGLNKCTAEELAKFTALNDAYKAKYGFPFILAVRNASKRAILGAFESRLQNLPGAELGACLKQVQKIAWMRILGAVKPASTGFLTCHVLDTARGCPAAGMALTLHRVSPEPALLGSWVTNDDGRLPGGPALKGEAFKAGTYEWTFQAGEYFQAHSVPVAGTPFLDEVPLRFGIDDPEAHYHVPLLVSPWSFSTYRGS